MRLRSPNPKVCFDPHMPWAPFFPSWAEVISEISRQEHRYALRGGKVSGVRMSQATWIRLCDGREARGERPGLGRPGQMHYDKKKLLLHPLYLDGDTPFGSVYVMGS